MTDRELLEFAAKAAGIVLLERPEVHAFCHGVMTTDGYWSPLADDGDAFRLAMKMGIDFCISPIGGALAWSAQLGDWIEEVDVSGDLCAAARRAIVRAAVAIGKAMP